MHSRATFNDITGTADPNYVNEKDFKLADEATVPKNLMLSHQRYNVYA